MWLQCTGEWNGRSYNFPKQDQVQQKSKTICRFIVKAHCPFHIITKSFHPKAGLQMKIESIFLQHFDWMNEEMSLKRNLCQSQPVQALQCISWPVPPSGTSTRTSSRSACWRSPPATGPRRLPSLWGRWSSWGRESILNLVNYDLLVSRHILAQNNSIVFIQIYLGKPSAIQKGRFFCKTVQNGLCSVLAKFSKSGNLWISSLSRSCHHGQKKSHSSG